MSEAFPPNHRCRHELNDEVHARPPNALQVPLQVSYLVMLCPSSERDAEWRHFTSLLQRYGHASPPAPSNYHFSQTPRFAIRYERHTEFSRYTITTDSASNYDFATNALSLVPPDWIGALLGEVLVAIHGVMLPALTDGTSPEQLAQRFFDGNTIVGSIVGDHAAAAFTDFRIRADGFSRIVIVDDQMTTRQAGRTLQRILEIDTYRMLALLALPVAQALIPRLADYENELSMVTHVLQTADARDEASLLDRLTHIEAQIESEEVKNRYRFTAANAYYEIVQRRISELREIRISGLQTFGEFTERRLAPAMNTCRAAAARQDSVSEHIARANELLATRVDLTRERQNQSLLESMNKRAKAQFELQQTVEGLSIAAITYYVVGLIGYVVKGLHAVGLAINYEIVTAMSIPIVAAFLALGVRLIHRSNRTEPAPNQ